MKALSNILFSSATALILIAILAVSLGVATFIEDRYDTATARHFVYNARWFEFLFLLLALNFIGHIQKYRLLRLEKIGGLLFHLSFIIMILGAAVTRYAGFEGTMHIREGESTNIIYSSEPYLRISFNVRDKNFYYEVPVTYSMVSNQSAEISLPAGDHNGIKLQVRDYIKNAVESLMTGAEGGKDIVELVSATGHGQETIRIESGKMVNIGHVPVAFNEHQAGEEAIKIIGEEGILLITSPHTIIQTSLEGAITDTILPGNPAEFKMDHGYHSQGAIFLFSKFYKSAIKKFVSATDDQDHANALILDLTMNDKKHTATLFGGEGYAAGLNEYVFDGFKISMGYGARPVELPFSLTLRDFILERYAGSNSPSSYASEVTLTDERHQMKQDHRIFMNNVLDYDMYRFFQSSYDQDEKGTILSVNHDFWGTWISYLGYFLLTCGFIITLFTRNSRFLTIGRYIREIREMRKSGSIAAILVVLLSVPAFSQHNHKPVDKDHAERFGQLITQSSDGRFEPVHTLAYDVMHKISRNDKFNIKGKGEMDAMQVFLDIMLDPDFWKDQKIIYVREPSVRDILGITGTHASFNDFLTGGDQYKLQEFAEKAFRKKQSEQNKFDKEIIKVDERVNIMMLVGQGTLLKIFPEQNSPNNRWIHWTDKAALTPITGAMAIINDDLQMGTLNYNSIMNQYLAELVKANETGDFKQAGKIVGYIGAIQNQKSNLIPSPAKIKAEIFYNEAQIFIVLKNVYALLSVLLLILAFFDNVRSKKSRFMTLTLNILTILLGVAFAYHTFGMILRWYLVGHAPWSNGYEALLLIAWSGLLAGFCFTRYSKITIAATALLAFFTLMTASHSSYDPQLTNLQPVLKSYWLIIHVATLTVSYGFFGLGFILGIINLIIYLLKTNRNQKRLDLLITEHSCINEMNLTVGIVLATVGTFLGGVWANESWGRYWGWDAKETWALVITLTYSILLHLRFVPKLKGEYIFTVGSVLGFGSVLMTFFGVNYYLSKGLHSYAAGSTPVFPLWAWIAILSVLTLIVAAGIKEARKETTNA